MRYVDSPRRPRDCHRRTGCASDGAEGHTGQLYAGDVRDEGTAVHDEYEGARLVEKVRCVWVHVLDQQVEEHGCVCCGVAERARGRTGRIGLSAAAGMDDGGVLDKRWEVLCAEMDEARNDIIASSSTILTILRLFWRRLGISSVSSVKKLR